MLMVTMAKKFSYKRFVVSMTEFSHHISEPVAERWLRGSCECEALFRKKKHFRGRKYIKQLDRNY